MSASAALFSAHALVKRWGGLVAVDHVSLDVALGQIHSVIGTNGAGKSTLVNLLSGELKADAGQVNLLGHDVTDWSQPRRARHGIGRSYQRSNIFPASSVLENCRLAAQANQQKPFDWLTPAARCQSTMAIARRAAERAGLLQWLDCLAGELSHGQQRQLEVAMCLAIEPRVLLLDEPLAGMGAEESERMLELLLQLKQDHGVLLIEHDMDAVFRVSDRITVMVDGQVIASGLPEDIRHNRQVQLAYLGESA
jgi:branched-chain amino acid transport system ATP-binding protein